MFSTTTMALSTNMPSARIKLNNTTMFMVKPTKRITLNDNSIDSGMAVPTNEEVRTPRKNNRTPTTRMSPEMMLFSRLLTMFRISID